MLAQFSRAAYARLFGPTLGDKVRLVDAGLFIEAGQDFVAAAASAAQSTLDDPGATTIFSDIMAMRHETHYSRLLHS